MALEIVTGETPDISEYLDFGLYDWVVYQTNAGLGKLILGLCIGVSHKVGQLMSYWILTVSGNPISCADVHYLAEAFKKTNEYKEQMEVFDKHLTDCITERDNENDITDMPDWNWLSIDEQDPKFDE